MVNITGGCHCGAIRYQVEGELIVHALCHCTDCRRHAGAPMVGWSMYAEDALKVTKGTPKVYEFFGAWPAAILRQLRHRPVLHQCECVARHRRYPERDLRRSRRRSGDGAYPDGRTASLDGTRPRTAHLRALSAAAIAAFEKRRARSSQTPQASREKTVRQRPGSDRSVLLQTRRREKSSRRARIARDFSNRGDGYTHLSNFRICRAPHG